MITLIAWSVGGLTFSATRCELSPPLRSRAVVLRRLSPHETPVVSCAGTFEEQESSVSSEANREMLKVSGLMHSKHDTQKATHDHYQKAETSGREGS